MKVQKIRIDLKIKLRDKICFKFKQNHCNCKYFILLIFYNHERSTFFADIVLWCQYFVINNRKQLISVVLFSQSWIYRINLNGKLLCWIENINIYELVDWRTDQFPICNVKSVSAMGHFHSIVSHGRSLF